VNNINGRTGQEVTATVTETPATGNARGRKPQCNHDLGNGKKCELNKGHELLDPKDPGYVKDHSSLDITEADLEMEFIPADEVPQVVRTTTQEKDPMRKVVADRVHAVYNEWVKQGSKPDVTIYARFTTTPEKAKKVRNWLRLEADAHTPPLQLKANMANVFVKGGKVQVPFGITQRRAYNRNSETATETPAQ
jgi:hypothetical protein